jgi:hypothetical protein
MEVVRIYSPNKCGYAMWRVTSLEIVSTLYEKGRIELVSVTLNGNTMTNSRKGGGGGKSSG